MGLARKVEFGCVCKNANLHDQKNNKRGLFMWSLDQWIILNLEQHLCCLSCYKSNNNKNPEGLCRNMKEVKKVFDESLKTMVDMLNADNLKGCYMLSNYMTTFTHLSDYRDAQFISEVLEGIFSQVGPSFRGAKRNTLCQRECNSTAQKTFSGNYS